MSNPITAASKATTTQLAERAITVTDSGFVFEVELPPVVPASIEAEAHEAWAALGMDVLAYLAARQILVDVRAAARLAFVKAAKEEKVDLKKTTSLTPEQMTRYTAAAREAALAYKPSLPQVERDAAKAAAKKLEKMDVETLARALGTLPPEVQDALRKSFLRQS